MAHINTLDALVVRNGAITGILAVKPSLTATFLDIAVSRDFGVFWIFEAARCKSKETIVGIKVVYGTYKHFRRVSCEKRSYYGYFIAVKPFLTATFLDIAVSRIKKKIEKIEQIRKG